MNALDMARTAYGSPDTPRTPRGREYEVLSQITGELRRTSTRTGEDYPRYVAALHRNREFWTTVAANVADENNQLTPELRARLFFLAEFTVSQTRRILDGTEDAEALIEINGVVMQGLRDTGRADDGDPR